MITNMEDSKRFIKVWQESNSVEEAAEKLNQSANTIRTKCSYYRMRGINLKRFRKRNELNWQELREYAESL